MARLRVVIVGATPDDAERLQARLERQTDDLAVAAVRAVAAIERGEWPPVVQEAYDAILVTRDAAAHLARGSTKSQRSLDADVPVESLTVREQEVLALLAGGLRNAAIADALGMSSHTVKFHLAAIYGKLGVSTRTAAVQRGVRLGLIAI